MAQVNLQSLGEGLRILIEEVHWLLVFLTNLICNKIYFSTTLYESNASLAFLFPRLNAKTKIKSNCY